MMVADHHTLGTTAAFLDGRSDVRNLLIGLVFGQRWARRRPAWLSAAPSLPERLNGVPP